MVIDLIGYRRYGHNEGDEPAYTQPRHVRSDHRASDRARALRCKLVEAEGVVTRRGADSSAPRRWRDLAQRQASSPQEGDGARAGSRRRSAAAEARAPSVDTAVPAGPCSAVNDAALRDPGGLHAQPEAGEAARERRATRSIATTGAIEWGHGGGAGLRLVAARGHADPPDRPGHRARHLQPAPPGAARRRDRRAVHAAPAPRRRAGARFELHNSPLSEYAALGFEYGYASTAPEALVHLGSAVRRLRQRRGDHHRPVHHRRPRKWRQTSRPDAAAAARLRGPGARALAARLERFLQLGAEDNMRVVIPPRPRRSTSTCCAARRATPSCGRWW